jgi:CRISPR-associated endonuclease/helicase Cas3
VWRAAAGLDSIAQAAGRCNREGRLALGRTVVFTPLAWRPPHALEAFWQAARPVLKQHSDVLALAAVHDYFRELYWQKGEHALDALTVEARRGILPAIAERAAEHSFSFRAIADAFRLIDEAMEPVIVPWDDDARKILARIAGAALATGADLRRLQQYTVSIPRNTRAEWLARGVLRPPHPALGEGLLAFGDLAHYRPETGLDLTDIRLRAAEAHLL